MASGNAMRLTCCVTQRFRIMKKVIFNICFIVIMALPCGYMFVDSGFFQAMGMCYTVFYVKDVLLPLFRRLVSLHDL